MNKLTLSLASAFICAAAASGELLFEETFDYADGALTTVGAENWSTTGGGAGQIPVSGGSIQLLMDGTVSEDVARSFGDTPVTGKVYASMDVQVGFPSRQPVEPGGIFEYFLHFGELGGATSGWNTRLFVVNPEASNDFAFGLGWRPGYDFIEGFSEDLRRGSFKIVVAYDADTGLSTFWLDPETEDSPSVSTETPYIRPTNALFLRQASNGGDEIITIDNIKVGTLFEDVIDVPETWYGYPVREDGYVDTGSWMDWVYVTQDPWIWNVNLAKWIFIQDGSGWAYVPK